jgi:hypothetical protein
MLDHVFSRSGRRIHPCMLKGVGECDSVCLIGSMSHREFASRPFKGSVPVHVVSVYKVFNGEEQVLDFSIFPVL